MLRLKIMETTTENTEQGTVSVTIRMDAAIHGAVKNVAEKEGRSLTKQIEQTLKRSPEVAELLETETV